jgi:hypothetical protein
LLTTLLATRAHALPAPALIKSRLDMAMTEPRFPVPPCRIGPILPLTELV